MTKVWGTTLWVLLCVSCSSSRETAEKPATTGTVRSAITTTDYRSLVLNDGAVSYWRLGDTGLTAVDTAPRGNGGTYVNTVSGSPPPNQNQPGALLGDSDTSAEFFIYNNPGTTCSYVSIPSDPNQSPNTHALTVEAWFTMTPGKTPQTYSAIVSKTGTAHEGYGLYWYSNALYFYINNLNIRVGVPLSAMGDTSRFHHVVGTYDGSIIYIYYDGSLVSSRPLAPTEGKGQDVNGAGTALWIGKSPWVSVGWQGRIDEVAIYPSALDAGHIQSHFHAARPPGPFSRAFVAYAQRSLTFGTGDHVAGGDVGVASTASQGAGPQLVIGASDVFDTQRGVFAPSVSLGSQAQVGGVSTNTLTNNGGTLGTQQSFPTSMPRLPPVPAGAPGTVNITVPSGRTQNLPPGSYGVLTVNGTLRLTPPGAFTFSSVNVAAGGIVYALPWGGSTFGNTTIRVDTTLTTGTGSAVVQVDGIAGDLSISVAGLDRGSSTPAVAIGANSQLIAVLNAPSGTVSIGDGSSVSGAVSAFSIAVGNNVGISFDPGAPFIPVDQTAAECVAAVQENALATRAPGNDVFNLATEAALARCRVPNLTPCENQVLAQANFDRRAAAFQYVAQTLSSAQYLALTRDRSRKLHGLATDATKLASVCAGDADHDLVPNGVDQCPDTPPLTPTTANGCTDSTIPDAPDRVAVDALLRTMGIMRDASCTGAQSPDTPAPFALCPVSGGGYTLWIKPSTNGNADCSLWYDMTAQLIHPDGSTATVAIAPQSGEFRPSPESGIPYVYFTMQPGDPGGRGVWAQASLAAAVVSIRAVNGNGKSSTWSSPTRLQQDLRNESLCADLPVNP